MRSDGPKIGSGSLLVFAGVNFPAVVRKANRSVSRGIYSTTMVGMAPRVSTGVK